MLFCREPADPWGLKLFLNGGDLYNLFCAFVSLAGDFCLAKLDPKVGPKGLKICPKGVRGVRKMPKFS